MRLIGRYRPCVFEPKEIYADINCDEYDKLIVGVALLRENNKVTNRNLLQLQLSLDENKFTFKIPTDETIICLIGRR